MQITIVDRVAMIMPWAGGLIPALMTFRNAQTNLGYGMLEAALIGLVVEGIGFVTITTALDLWEIYQAEKTESSKNWGVSTPTVAGQYWVAIAGVLVYLFVVISINALLDDGDIWHKLTLALMSSFGLLGGLMVALRNQMGKRLQAMAEAESRRLEQESHERLRLLNEHNREMNVKAERERDERVHARRMEEERLRMEHDERLRKIEEGSRRKIAKIEVDGVRKVAGNSPDGGGKLPEDAGKSPEVAGKLPDTRLRWSDVSPDDYRWIVDAPVSDIVARYKLSGKDPERLARTWKVYARSTLDKLSEDQNE